MKNKPESVKSSSKTAAASQSKTAPPGAEFHPARGGLTVPILHPDGTEWTRVEFNAAERRRIEAFLKATGFTLQELFEKAVASRMESISAEAAASIPKTPAPEELEPSQRCAHFELQSDIAGAIAFIEAVIAMHALAQGDIEPGSHNDLVGAGLMSLARTVGDNLRNTCQRAFYEWCELSNAAQRDAQRRAA